MNGRKYKLRKEERVVRKRRDIIVRVNVDKIGGISVRSPIANADKNERVDGDNISAFKLAGEFAANDTANGVAMYGDNITLIAAEKFNNFSINFGRIHREPSFSGRDIRIFARLIFVMTTFSIFDHIIDKRNIKKRKKRKMQSILQGGFAPLVRTPQFT